MGNNTGLRNLDTDTKNNLFRKESNSLVNKFDGEIDNLIFECYEKTKELINNNLNYLEKIKNRLIIKETINQKDFDNIFKE